MPSPVSSLLAGALDTEFGAFMGALRGIPAAVFSAAPAHSHSAAWHALQVMDWTRGMIQPGLEGVNPALAYGHLGFEDTDWARRVTGPTLAAEHDPKDQILAALAQVFTEACHAVHTAPAQPFAPEALWTTLKRPRPVLDGLTYHLRHTAYHRGQVALVLKELS